MFDKDKFKTSLTSDDIIKILKHYDADIIEGKNGELISTSICHNKSGGSHKLYYYPDGHSFHCYTGCGSFDIYDLIIKVNGMRGRALKFTDAIKEVGNILNIHINFRNKIYGVQKNIKTIDVWDWLEKVQRKEKLVPELKVHDDSILKYFNEIYPSSWYEEGISLETMEKYEIKFYPEQFQTVIPHRDGEGNLVGIRSRNWDKQLKKRAKYIPTYVGDKGYNHPLGYALYGLYQNKETIKRKKKAMIVEGEKSCLFSDTLYDDDNFVVAICGSNMSQYQADLLLELGIEEVIIALDKEYLITDSTDFEEYMSKVKRIGRMFAPYVQTYHITDTRSYMGLKESPLDLDKEVLEDVMENDKHLLTLKDLGSED